ncbi:hypothetical protein [Streptomyces sp. NPDC006368]|uniref:hypothetical protein n=1 Tax=Streptomyces sp. NPDC006368 TaxID=3156760 RepID=UPI0033A24F0F
MPSSSFTTEAAVLVVDETGGMKDAGTVGVERRSAGARGHAAVDGSGEQGMRMIRVPDETGTKSTSLAALRDLLDGGSSAHRVINGTEP